MSVSERKFGTLPTGEEVKIYHLENKKVPMQRYFSMAQFW